MEAAKMQKTSVASSFGAWTQKTINSIKTCTKCGELKDLKYFYKSKNGKYGRRGDCKSCIYKISRLPENVQKSREYNRLYRKTEKWKIYMKEYRKRTGKARVWVKKYSDKKKTDPVYVERRKLQKKKYYESESFKLLRGTVQYKLKVVIRSRINIAIKATEGERSGYR
jgi:hypothetical protein